MLHPFKPYAERTPIEKMDKIEATIVLCTLFRGVPIGPAIIEYHDLK